jgi:5,10-methenyltetrahydromethanopterin hydrogenase
MAANDIVTTITIPAQDDDTVYPAGTTEYDIAFPVIPTNLDPSPPTISSAVSDLTDFAADQAADNPSLAGLTPQDTDILFDWDVGEPAAIVAATDATWVEGDDYVVEWFAKAMQTPRGKYLIYDSEYGTGLFAMVGSGIPDQTLFSEITRDVIATATYHPQIVDCDVLGIQQVPAIGRGILLIDCELTTDSDEDPVSVVIQF